MRPAKTPDGRIKGIVESVLNLFVCYNGEPISAVYGASTADVYKRQGLDADNLVRDSRKAIASAVGCPADRLFFTSCATESNNIALFGGLRANQRLGRKVITTAVEHASVLEPLHVLEQQGYDCLLYTSF